MRELTIKRRRAFAASFMVANVYIQDSESGDLTIRGYSCRFLGNLKNGEEKTFDIPSEETRIFVIYDYMSMEFCVDMKKIPAGEENVRVSGVCKFNIGSRNAFRFDGDIDDEVAAVRTGGSKKGIMKTPGMVLIICVIIGVLSTAVLMGIDAIDKNTPKRFAFDGIEITLNRSFNVFDNPNFVGGLSSTSIGVAVYIERDRFDEMKSYTNPDKMTVEEYAELIVELSEMEDTPETKNGVVWVANETINKSNGKEIIEFIAFYKSDDSFWIVEFDVLKNRAEKYSDEIEKWADSVRFET